MTENSRYRRPLGWRGTFPAFLALLVFAGPQAQAQLPIAGGGNAAGGAASSPCDMEYYESLKSRAWLEAQREITQNQNLIFKPDSVLQYTCFDQFLGVLGAKASSMFSDSAPPPPGPPLGQLLQTIVGTAVNSHLNTNFNHTMLGGRSSITYRPSNSSTYNCTMMNEVWKAAKCMNFAEKPEDGFFTFAQYAASPDKRLPRPPGCPGSNLWNAEIRSATGAQSPWPKDPVKTFFKEMTECKSDQWISTGIKVDDKDEKFCISPGCYFDGNGCKTASASTQNQTQTP